MTKKTLIIVESPTKSRTLARFLGDGYELMATMGHLRNLPKTKLGVDVKGNFKPQYVLIESKKAVIDQLKKASRVAKQIFLATDPDREGEAIAWHTVKILGDTAVPIHRISFHEITRRAIEEALKHLGKIDMHLVDAQQARRVLDRLVGYQLSPLLWRKVRLGLSAGRVQSVALRLVVEREQEIGKFKSEEYWELWAELKGQPEPTFLAKLVKIEQKTAAVKNQTTAQKIVGELQKAAWQVAKIDRKEVHRASHPPFTTSTMQQRAAQKLYFSSRKTMQVAQQLYEQGLITYHRTDSFSLASQAVVQIRRYINSVYGANYLPLEPRVFKTRSKVAAQEAHEAIRPTRLKMPQKKLHRDEMRLYKLIFNRTVASQMAAAVYDQTKIHVQAGSQYRFLAEGRVIKFLGWLKIYSDKIARVSQVNQKAELPKLAEGEKLKLVKLDPQQKFTQPPARYNEASLIRALEQRGIGRPSTYAPIISTIQARQYVERKERIFSPTNLGVTVSNFLVRYFPEVFDYDFTAQLEDQLDEVARGERRWQPVIKEFYQPFTKQLAKVMKESQRVKIPVEKTDQKCPQCQKGDLIVRVGRFGKFLACSRFPECRYTSNFIEKIEGIKCPDCGGEVVIRKTRSKRQFFGCSRYPQCRWASWRDPRKMLAKKSAAKNKLTST